MVELAKHIMPLTLLLTGGKDQYPATYQELFGKPLPPEEKPQPMIAEGFKGPEAGGSGEPEPRNPRTPGSLGTAAPRPKRKRARIRKAMRRKTRR
jgi:hypothetical protein